MASNAIARANSERRFYTSMAIFMIAMVLIGFAPSFYFRGLVFYPLPNPVLNPLVLFHGIVFSAWMILFLVHARLVAARRKDVHMRLGRWVNRPGISIPSKGRTSSACSVRYRNGLVTRCCW